MTPILDVEAVMIAECHRLDDLPAGAAQVVEETLRRSDAGHRDDRLTGGGIGGDAAIARRLADHPVDRQVETRGFDRPHPRPA